MYQGLSIDQAPPEDIPIRFFLTAPFALIGLGVMMLSYGGSLFEHVEGFQTVLFTHLITIGWLCMIMMGAYYQMVPVMIGGHVPFIGLARVVHLCVLGGILSLAGFLTSFNPILGQFAFTLFAIGFGIFLIQIGYSVLSVEGEDRPTLSAMRTSLLSLAVTVILGLSLLGSLLNWWPLPFETYQGRYLHILFGLLGWVSLLIIGVSFHLIPMFYVTPPFATEDANRIIRLIQASLFLGGTTIALNWGHWAVGFSLSFGGIGLALYLYKLTLCLQTRKRKRPDPTIRFWEQGSLYLAVCLLAILSQMYFTEGSGQFLIAGLFLMGFSLSITTGMLLKIFPFILWFHRYSSLVGTEPVPMVGDLIPYRQQFHFQNAMLLLTLLFLPALYFDDHWGILLSGVGFSCLGVWFFKLLFQAYLEIIPKR